MPEGSGSSENLLGGNGNDAFMGLGLFSALNGPGIPEQTTNLRATNHSIRGECPSQDAERRMRNVIVKF
jgi:hypothetical protein